MSTRTKQTLPINRTRRSRLAAMPGYVAAIKKLRAESNRLETDAKEWAKAGAIVLAHQKYEQSKAMQYAWLWLENQAI